MRDAGVGRNPAVATAVGATVLTDMLALIVPAVVAGTQTGYGSAAGVLAVIVTGLAVLLVVMIAVRPRLAAAAHAPVRVGGATGGAESRSVQ